MMWLVWTLLAGCGGESTQTPATVAPPTQSAAEASPVPQAVEPAQAPHPSELSNPTEPRYAATHILIAYTGAVGAPSSITRTRAEADALAAELHERVSAGESLHTLATAYSDGPSAPRGGSLGTYLTGTMVPDFERAVASVAPGELAPLVHTPFGVHIVRRDAVIRARVAHLLVSHANAHQPLSTRSRDEAQSRAEQALAQLHSGHDFAEVVSSLGDRDGAGPGGDLGWISPGQMIPAFEQAAFALSVGEVSGLVETPYGFHILRRSE